jgi:hypothetical protein
MVKHRPGPRVRRVALLAVARHDRNLDVHLDFTNITRSRQTNVFHFFGSGAASGRPLEPSRRVPHSRRGTSCRFPDCVCEELRKGMHALDPSQAIWKMGALAGRELPAGDERVRASKLTLCLSRLSSAHPKEQSTRLAQHPAPCLPALPSRCHSVPPKPPCH